MLDFTDSDIELVIVHHVGNQTNNEDLILSKSLLTIQDSKLRELLVRYLLHPFANSECYAFSFSNDNFRLNPLYQFASTIFADADTLTETSADIAKHLYEIAIHPQIKSGDLFLATFNNIEIDGKFVEGFGIFKSENKHPFLKLNNSADTFVLNYEDAINIEKLDKGCLILNVDSENGYKVYVVDKTSKSAETQYWKDVFLNVNPAQDEYHFTKEFLVITKDFVTQQLTEDFEVSKTDQIDLLNRSVDYFKSHDTFDKQEFEEEVFSDSNVIESFRKFDQTYRQENDVELSDSFEISTQAVKKQARIFKSVLKLDKNFHIYIHGDKELIEQGVDANGRKYYKIYYEEEN